MISASVPNLSVGVANAGKVVVPRLLLQQQSEDKVACILRELREGSCSLLALVNEAKRLVEDAFDEVGIQSPRDGTGHFPLAR